MNLTNLIDIPAMLAPDDLCVIDQGTITLHPHPLDYSELRQRSARVTGLLRSMGVAQGDRVGVLATNCAGGVEVTFGAAALGAPVVHMNFKAAHDELAHLLTDSGVTVLFSERRYRDAIAAAAPQGVSVILFDEPDQYEAALDAAEPDHDIADVDPDSVAVLLYTSGTTSKPKGVKLSHGSLTRYVMEANDVADGSDQGVMLLAVPLYHVAGLTSLLNCLYSGRTTVLLPQFTVEGWLETVQQHGVTHSFLVPTMMARILAAPAFASTDLSSLRSLTYGAAPMPHAVICRAIAAFPSAVDFAGAYGQTETTSTVAVLGPDDHRIEGDADTVAERLQRLRSVGKMVGDVELRVVGPDSEVLAAGEVGEVHLRTARTMSGYWGSADRTRITVDEDGWVHTGDRGYVDHGGYLFLVGREGDMIIRGGENVSPEEVENTLYNHHGVREVGVCGVEDEEFGERIVATVVVDDGVTVESLEAFAREHLAPFKRPSEYVLVDELPRTSTGKLVRRRLQALLETEPR